MNSVVFCLRVVKRRIEGSEFHVIADQKTALFFLIKKSKDTYYTRPDNYITLLLNQLYGKKELYNRIAEMELDDFLKNKNIIEEILSGLKNTENLELFIQDYMQYFNQICDVLEKDSPKALQICKEDMNLDISWKQNIFILPSFLGIAFSYKKNVYYGINYRYPALITIFHEILHSYLPEDDHGHTLIELITNGHLLKKMYGVDDEIIYMSGHWFLSSLKVQIIEDWFEFLQNTSSKSVIDFYNRMRQKSINFTDEKYRLSNRVIYTKGPNRSLLIDDRTKNIIRLNNDFFRYVKNGVNPDLDELNSQHKTYIKQLVELGIVVKSCVSYENDITKIPCFIRDLKVVCLEINNYCNYNCKHCYFYNTDLHERAKRSTTLNLEQIKKIVEIAKPYGLKHINILGGEPMLSDIEYLKDILAYFHSLDFISGVNIFSNLSPINEEYYKIFEKFKKKIKFHVTFHSDDSEYNDEIAGYKGDFDNKLMVLEKFKKKNIKAKVHSIISRYNYNRKTEIKFFIEKLNKDLGNSRKTRALDISRVSESFSHILDTKQDYSDFKIDPMTDFSEKTPVISSLLSRVNKHSCWSDKLSIDCNYNVFLCAEMHTPESKIGNLKDIHTAENLFNDNFKRVSSTVIQEEKCGVCEYRYLCHHCTTIVRNLKHYGFDSFCSYDPYREEKI